MRKTDIKDNGDGTLTITETQTIVTVRKVGAAQYKLQLESQKARLIETKADQIAEIEETLAKVPEIIEPEEISEEESDG